MRYPRLTSTALSTAAVLLLAVVLAGCGGGGHHPHRRLPQPPATAWPRSRPRRSSKRPRRQPREPARCTSPDRSSATASRSGWTWNCSPARAARARSPRKASPQPGPGQRLGLHQRQHRLLQARRRHRRGAAAAGQVAEGAGQQRRTRLARLAHRPQQTDHLGPGPPRHPLQGRQHDDRRPARDRPQRLDQGRHPLRRHHRQALPPGDRQARQGKRQSHCSTGGTEPVTLKAPADAIDISKLQNGH